MQIICMPQAGGKTHEAIKISAETWSYIVCLNKEEGYRVFHQAKNMGFDIPYPITFDEFINGRYSAQGIRGFIIDNADMLLQSLTPVRIKAITLNMDK